MPVLTSSIIMKNHPAIFVTDPEGNLAYFLDSIRQSADLYKTLATDDPLWVIGGDISDKGAGELQILKYIKEFSDRQPCLLIAGNRDDNKIRFLAELTNKSYIENLLTINKPPHWDPKPANTPMAFYQDFVKKNESLDLTEDALKEKYTALSFTDKRCIMTQWLLAKTMGSPNKFEFRRTELITLRPDLCPISDDMIVQSFIEEMALPEELAQLRARGVIFNDPVLPTEYQGLMRWYIEHSHAMEKIGNTFYSHAGLPSGVFPYLLSSEKMPALDTASGVYTAADFQAWIQCRNAERQMNIQDFIAQAISGTLLLEPELSKHPAMYGALPKNASTNPYSSQSANSFDYSLLPEELSLLKDAGITQCIHGHQPVLTPYPRLTKLSTIDDYTLSILNADTSMVANVGQVANATMVMPHGFHSISVLDGCRYQVDSRDAYQGQRCQVNAHDYEIAGRVIDASGEVGDYLLVCRDKVAGALFLSVSKDYGVLHVPPAQLDQVIGSHAFIAPGEAHQQTAPLTTVTSFLSTTESSTKKRKLPEVELQVITKKTELSAL